MYKNSKRNYKKSRDPSILKLIKDEYKSNIMLGYTIFLFNIDTNKKLLYIIRKLTGDESYEID